MRQFWFANYHVLLRDRKGYKKEVMKGKWSTLATCFWLATACALHGQGTFQNLNFESAILPVIPSGQYGSLEPIASALPNWTGYIATNQQSQVLHNNFSLGLPSLGVFGPNWVQVSGVIEGNFSAVIQAGYEYPIGQKSASLAQTALIPSSANSIRMTVQPIFGPTDISQLNVAIGGQIITMLPITTTASYVLLGGDISTFSGLTRELRITALPSPTDPYTSFVLDSITFSNQPIPEPSAFSLFALGTSLLGWRSRRVGF